MKNTLLYSHPATEWTEALPLGNGRMGAMHFGGVEVDRLQLNEDTLWSGPPSHGNRSSDAATLKKIRESIDHGQYEQAEYETKNILGPDTQAYMPFGNLLVQYLHSHVTRSYKRKLDINEAVSTVSYTVGQVDYTREVLVSHPHQVLAIKLTSSVDQQLNVMLSMDSLLKHATMSDGHELVLQGICPEYCAHVNYQDDLQPVRYGKPGETSAIHFEGRVSVDLKDGELVSENGKLVIENATSAVIYLTITTSFNGYDQKPGSDFTELTRENKDTLSQAMGLSYDIIKSKHVEDYQSLFSRVDFSLEADEESEHLDTDERVKAYGANDPKMIELLFQYGRYLLISSSREGTQPANLQGIWNESTRAPWSSNYTLNINAEMNYWPAEITNLAECHRPLLQAVKELSAAGEKMVRERYGLNGWAAHHNTDLWRHAEPVGVKQHGDPIWAFWPMSGTWLSNHLWQHYTYSQDQTYLKEEAFPVMKGAVQFCLEWLAEDQDGYLVTSPSTSPEHKFIAGDGQVGSVTAGASMDLQLIWDLFTNYIGAAAILNIEDPTVTRAKDAKARLRPIEIGKYGQLQEWMTDYEDTERHHRHVSHLYAIYPGKQITEGPLFEAARQTLNIRGDAGTGWSFGWKLCLWARLQDGERVSRLLQTLFNIVDKKADVTGGGLYPNLFGAHPPFQIDGNFGYTAGIVETIVQSHKGYVELLPALPPEWISGKISGIRIPGGFELNIEWKEMRTKTLEVICKADNLFALKTERSVTVYGKEEPEIVLRPKDGMVSFDMQAGERYNLLFH